MECHELTWGKLAWLYERQTDELLPPMDKKAKLGTTYSRETSLADRAKNIQHATTTWHRETDSWPANGEAVAEVHSGKNIGRPSTSGPRLQWRVSEDVLTRLHRNVGNGMRPVQI